MELSFSFKRISVKSLLKGALEEMDFKILSVFSPKKEPSLQKGFH